MRTCYIYFFSFKECNCKGDGMTGGCDHTDICYCKSGYHSIKYEENGIIGIKCKSMSNNKFTIH